MTDAVQPKAGRREWVGLAVLALPAILVSLDIFVVLLALPELSARLGAGSNQQLWIVDIYGFMVAGFLVTMGNLGDRIGRRKLLLIGAAAFGLASIVAAYSTSAISLIIARAVLGIAGATLGPSTLSLISNMFRDDKQRASAIGIWAGSFSLGAIIGPIVGGVMLEHFWWGSVFLLGVPPMVLLLVAGPMLLPEYRNEQAGRIDLTSVLLSLVAVLPFIYGVKEIAKQGFAPVPVVALVVGLAMAVIFLRRQRALADPLLDLRLFTNKIFNTELTSMLFYSALTGTTMLFVAQYFQSVAGMTPLQAGLGLLPGLVLGIVSVTVGPQLAGKIRPGRLIAGGLLIVVAGLVVLTQADSAAGMIIGYAIWCLGGGPLLTLGTGLVVGSVPPEKAGSASSLSQIANEFGYAIGIATIGTIGALVYRTQIADAIPASVPAAAADAARESVAGATAAAGGLPGQVAETLLAPAREAFSTGLHIVAAISALIVLGVAVLNAVVLRELPAFGQPPAGGGEAPAGGAAAGEASDPAAGPAADPAAGPAAADREEVTVAAREA
ncbi:MFS transporter [Sphaerisporangium rufum]|uniref:MFS transporter n=1 Tax=Sphaerisporangium rufum TaxID=1381558 RepID=A0A919UZE6_9ACTN|nr:MFS transporter [Sphaerisporangium rufum]GII76212.1 MFS transporter [Sphaerisporangium rufum]